jgi:hypothetical protein
MPVTYTHPDEYMLQLPHTMQPVFMQVRMLLLTFPEITERMRYNIPFYDHNGKMMFYLTLHQKKKLVLGFCNGYLLEDNAGVLRQDQKQKYIRHWEFLPEPFEQDELLIEYIQQAIAVNKQLQRTKHERKTRNIS